jgi:hypothetical protein
MMLMRTGTSTTTRDTAIMKALSAAIVILAGAILIVGGVVGRGDEGSAALLVGYVIGFIGLVVWGVQLFPGTTVGPPSMES